MLPQGPTANSASTYLRENTIIALATPLGGAIAVLRVSGSNAGRFLSALTKRKDFSPRELTHCQLLDSTGHPLDDAMVVWFQAPQTFTGEEMAEIHIHGNALIAREILALAAKNGVEQALPGEFAFRAVRNQKLTLSQAQALPDLLEAKSSRAVTQALHALSGGESEILLEVFSEIKEILVRCEAEVDFSDQAHVTESARAFEDLKKNLKRQLNQLKKIQATFQQGRAGTEDFTVTLMGLPNAGKSSLFNSLLGESRSIVTEIPGTTRDVVSEQVVFTDGQQSLLLRLEDTAGVRELCENETGEEKIEREGIEKTRRQVLEADLLLWVIDASTFVEKTTRDFLEKLDLNAESQSRLLPCLTKIDLLVEGALCSIEKKFLKTVGLTSVLGVSSKTHHGISNLIEEILIRYSETLKAVGEKPNRAQYKVWVDQAFISLQRGIEASDFEFMASDLRRALAELAPLVGEVTSEDILQEIFSRFCIGK